MWLRYPSDSYIVQSALDPLEDAANFVRSLSAQEYCIDILRKVHRYKPGPAEQRAKSVSVHIRRALEFLDQAQSGPRSVVFLPLYYAILNMMKTYIVVGPHYRKLTQHRWHGARYDVQAKSSRSLLTEEIEIKKGGAIPLWYETITGKQLTQDRRLRIGDILPYILGITAEYNLATGRHAMLVGINVSIETVNRQNLGKVTVTESFKPVIRTSKQTLKVLGAGWRKLPNREGVFLGPSVPSGPSWETEVRASLNNYLIYYPDINKAITPVCGMDLHLPEELPIALLFFYMSSVTRYKPEFLAKLRDSRFWPLLMAAQRHCVLKMLILLWSYVHQRALILSHK